MTTYTFVQGTRTSLTCTGLSTLASANYVASSAYDTTTNHPLDVIVEASLATTNTPTGNKQAILFLQASLDGSNFQSGPSSGTTTTDEPDLTPLGVVPVNTSTTTHRKSFSVYAALGYIPQQFNVVVKNDLGVALTSGTLHTAEISGVS